MTAAQAGQAAGAQPAPKSANIVRARGKVGPAERAALLSHSALTVWFTGLSGSGKSTLAYEAERRLLASGVLACVLDGDNLRFGLCSDLGFSPQDRSENIRRAGEAAVLLGAAGAVVLAAFVSPYKADRDRVRAMHPPGAFVEAFVDTPLRVCRRRDPKGLYAKADRGEITDLTGVGSPYEAPLDPEIRIDTDASEPSESTELIVAEVLRRVR